MKIAIAGKGGAGKTTVAAALARLLAEAGWRVLAVDADPDSDLPAALGFPPELVAGIVPVSEQKALVEERTGARVREYGQLFKLNPEVSDLADRCATSHDGVSLLVLGAIESGGSGCACAESALLRALVADLVLHRTEALVLDFEAGLEHLGRGTARGVDTLLVVMEPGRRSLESSRRVFRMAAEIGIRDVRIVANKVASAADLEFIREGANGHEVVGVIPDSVALRGGDRAGRGVAEALDPELRSRFAAILETLTGQGRS